MKIFYSLLCSTALLAVSSPAFAITSGQTDTFDIAADVAAWSAGGAGPSISQTTLGGGAGGSVGYLSVSQTDFHLVTKNTVQWAGDFLAAGVTSIEMDLKSFSFVDTGSSPNGSGPAVPSIHLVLFSGTEIWESTAAFTLTIGGGWEHAVFGLSASDLTQVGGTGTLAATLGSVTQIQIRHDYDTLSAQGSHPPHVTADLGVDNITAVPEPSSILLLLTGAWTVFLKRSRKSHC